MRRILALAALLGACLALPAAAGTPTTHYSLTKPSVSADADTWGTMLNGDLDTIDATLFSLCPKAGCTYTGKLNTAASATGGAGLNLPHGAAPTSPVDGDVWSTTAGILARINGTTQGVFFLSGGTLTGKLNTAASATGGAGFSLIPGVAPSSPVNGDCWLTATTVQCQVGGSTLTLASTSGAVTSFNSRTGAITLSSSDVTTALTYTPANKAGDTLTGRWIFNASTTGGSSLNIPNGTAPTSPATGDLWAASGALKYYDGASTRSLAFLDSTFSGNTTGSAAKWTTSRTETATGDATGSASVDGSASWSIALTLANSGVSAATYGDSLNVGQVALDAKGRATAASNVPIATLVGDSGSGGTKGLVPAPAAGDAAAGKYLNASGAWVAIPVQYSAFATISGGFLTLQGGSAGTNISRGSAGVYTVNFPNLTNANFTVICTSGSTGGGSWCLEDSAQTRTTSSVGLRTQGTGGANDPARLNVTIIPNP